MDIKQLTYFMAVAQEGSYSKAAEKLGLEFKLIINEQQLI